ncbi:MAG: aldo/keto reductase [Arachnia sp.]
MPLAPTVALNDAHTIPQLGLGVWQMSDDQAQRAVVAAAQAGYRHIDTAAIYRNEAGVGRGIAETGLAREELFITTKLWNAEHRRDDAHRALATSLELLGLDYVDLYLIHWPAPTQNRFVEAWEALIDLRSAGLARSIGVSNFTADHLNTIVDETGVRPAVNQIELHPTFQAHDLINQTTDLGIVVESWSPLGQAKDLDNPTIASIAADLGVTPAQVIIRWHLDRGFVVIPKSADPGRIRANFDVFSFALTSAQREAIDSLDTGERLGGDPDEVD